MTTTNENAGAQENELPSDAFCFEDIQGEEANQLMEEAEEEANRFVLSMEHRAFTNEMNYEEVYSEPSLMKRAKLLVAYEAINFVHFRPMGKGETGSGMVARTDSALNRHAVFDSLFDFGSGRVPFPHYDTFKGRLVDHHGETFSTRNLRTRELVEAVNEAGLTNPSAKEITDSLYSWALDHRRDSLRHNFESKIPKWDGISRFETLLLDLFKPKDTLLNRLFGKYFWLSLYNRINDPGAMAPIVLSLIGAQDVGKSYFSVLLCRLLTGDPEAGPVLLDLSAKNYNPFLRSVTGKSVIANVGELMGFTKGDMNRIKEFITKTEDDLDFKFEDTIIKPRQWITIMDGNNYEGLQRDDTGNRRFYPIFVFQTEDVEGKPAWEGGKMWADSGRTFEPRKIDFSNFEHDLWQVMAEARVFMEKEGKNGYARLVADTNRAVSAFSTDEMKSARGVIRDDNIENNLTSALLNSEYREISGRSAAVSGWFIANTEINRWFYRLSRKEPFSRGLVPHMRALGFVPKQSGTRGYMLPHSPAGVDVPKRDTTDMQDMLRHIAAHSNTEDMSDAELDSQIAFIRGEAEKTKAPDGF